MKIDAIKKELEKTTDGRLFIYGYKTSSGAVMNYTLEFLEEGRGYFKLVEESLQLLPTVGNGSGLDQAVFDAAKEELENSFKKTLAGTHAPRQSNVQLESVEQGRYFLRDGNPDEVVIKDLRVIEAEVVQSSGDSKKQADKTKAKDWIRNQLPIGEYLGRLVLKEGKVDRVEVQKQ